MKKSPFTYGTTVSKESFTNRESETERLYSNLTNGINTSIISPRRWGKSSLVEQVLLMVRQRNPEIRTVAIDLFSIGAEEEFYEVFAKEVIKASSSKWQDWVESGRLFFKQLLPKISFGIDPMTDFSLEFDWEEVKKHPDEILNLPEIIAEKSGKRFIICLDEFQNLANYSDFEDLEKKMRASWQRQKKVTYCLYGSKRHMMMEIFNNSSKPFYRFGDLMLLQKITQENWVSFIKAGFKSTGKLIEEEEAALIPKLMKCHSWYVQQLAHYTWQKTADKADKKVLNEALKELIWTNTPLYQKEVESISNTQLNLLKAIVAGKKKFTSTKVMRDYKLGTPNNVTKNKAALIDADIIHEFAGTFELLDPAFELWFLKQFMDKDFSV